MSPSLAASDLLPLWPAIILSAGAILLLLSEAFLSGDSRGHQAPLSLVFALAACVAAAIIGKYPEQEVLHGFGVLDPFSTFLSATICAGLVLAILFGCSFVRHRGVERGEFYALMLFSAAGMSLLAMSAELITLFVNLEIVSITTYALASYLRRGARPLEAGLKYFILGAFSSAVLLYGIALLYGATGSTSIAAIARSLPEAVRTSDRLVYLSGGLIAAGLAFKVAAVPFHMWAPDVYEGAPTPVTALMSSGVKAAAFAALIRVFLPLGQSSIRFSGFIGVVLAALALATMVVGNLSALPQRNVKRMLAYSSIAHAGYLLLGVTSLFVSNGSLTHSKLLAATPLLGAQTSGANDVISAILFYLFAYTLSATGAFATVSALERREDEERGTAWDLERFAGLAQRRPGWAIAMAIFMLSLGGIPPTIGFFGKLLIFRSAIDAGYLALAVVGILSSVAGAYYYLRIVVYMFMRPALEGDRVPERHLGADIALGLSAAGVVLLGIAPGILSYWLSAAVLLTR